MNKKDVLGTWLAAWNVQKMESMPHGLSAGNAQFPALNRQGQGMVFGAFVLSDTSKNKN